MDLPPANQSSGSSSSHARRLLEPSPAQVPPSYEHTSRRTSVRNPHTPASYASPTFSPAPCRIAGVNMAGPPTCPKEATQNFSENPSEQPVAPAPSQGTNAEAVRRFLESLAEPSGELLSQFVANGVSTASSLRALGLMSAEERDGFLQEDLELNPFQACLVRDGLRRLVEQ